MTNYKINGKKVSLPDGWHDVPFYKGLEIMKSNSEKIDAFCIITGLDKSFVRSLKDPSSIEYLMGTFLFLKDYTFKAEMPLSIIYDGDIIHIPNVDHDNPFDMGQAEVGQIEDMEVIIRSELKDVENIDAIRTVEIMPKIISIYVQKLIDKHYDHRKAMSIVKTIEQTMSFKDVMCMGYFFLQKLKDYTNGFQSNYRKSSWMKRKLKQASTILTNHLVSMQR